MGLLRDHVPSLSAVALLAACVPVEVFYGGFTEISSDLFCSIFLLIANELASLRRDEYSAFPESITSDHHPIMIAAWFGIHSVCRSLTDVRWSTPAALPALLAVRLGTSTSFFDQPQKSTILPLLKSLRISLIIAVISLLLLRRPDDSITFAISVLALVAQVAGFTHLHQAANRLIDYEAPGISSRLARSILRQTVAVLVGICCVILFSEGFDRVHAEGTVKLGLMKAVKWAFILYLVNQKTPWDIASAGSIFGYGICEAQSLHWAESVGPAIVAMTAVVHSYFLLGKSTAHRVIVLSMVIMPLSLVIFKFWPVSVQEPCHHTVHPIVALSEQATAEFSAMLERQSANLTVATDEYKRRYGRKPPPGFDRWFDFAKSQNSPIIDEFDMIDSMMEPFWKINPERLRANVNMAMSGDNVVSLHLREGYFSTGSSHWMTTDFAGLLGSVAPDIPDFDAVFNPLDEPRVLMSSSGVNRNSDESEKVEWYDGSRQSESFEKMTTECDRRRMFQHISRANIEDFGLPFVEDISAAKDICQHPEYRDQHGFLEKPDTFRITKNAVPMFTQSKPSTFDDLLIPAPIYRRFYKEHMYDESQDVPWEEKYPTLYWAGSTTGSRQGDATDWRKAHRQRFVAKAQHLQNSTQTFLTEAEPGVWKAYKSTDVLSKQYDARFTAVIQCDSAACNSEKDYFHPSDRVQPSESLRSRFLFDLDGNAYSGRFYVLLRSHSAVLKQTIFQEWHDERLFPWVHYVPVSMSMDELPETMRFLALTDQGDAIAQRVAEEGREWRMKALREEDQIVYMYRLLLEYSRVLRDDRDELVCTGCEER
ncbi:glycosyl transferase family 90-domain-containing protein [Phyllosticta capitalensis]|uniref:Glycosyl transferase family 90-domain-containing protein n=1 Tax=Phyllosticta capitalensis TaxID=121624 RepID=A0ABR1YEA7_9PEZI